MVNTNYNIDLPEKKCPICKIDITESSLFKESSRYYTYSCPNCGYFSICITAYRSSIINNPVTKQKVSYYVRNHSAIDNPISIESSEVSTIEEKTKLPSEQERFNILLGWIGSISKLTLDTVDGNTKHLIALLGCMDQQQVIQILDEIWKLGYIEMENPVDGPLRKPPLFDLFACHLTSAGIKRIQEIKSEPIKFEGNKIDLEYLLKNDESTNLEVKGSCQLDLNRLLKEGGKPILTKQLAKDGVLKTIVAFLNSSGGDILIGALEKDKFSFEQINKIPFVEYENYYLIGVKIENDILDKYQLTLRNIIESHISRSMVGLLEITFPQTNGFTLCRISVSKAEHKWYYLNNEIFYVRDGNRTISLNGNAADEHKKRNPR